MSIPSPPDSDQEPRPPPPHEASPSGEAIAPPLADLSPLTQVAAEATLAQFTLGIIHDLKNPLTVIQGVVEMLLAESDLPPSYRENLELIRTSARKALHLLASFADFARPRPADYQPHDLRCIVEAALQLLSFQIRHANIRLSVDLPPQPVWVWCEAHQMEQVIVNLLLNAIQAMPQGGALHIHLAEGAEGFSLRISDSGVGIPPQDLERIFTPFFTTKAEQGGLGLGLSLSAAIIAAHGGRITVSSVPGRGSVFTVWLPPERATSPPQGNATL